MDKCILYIHQIQREWSEMVNLTTYNTAQGSNPKPSHSTTPIPPSQDVTGLKTRPQRLMPPPQASARTLHSHHSTSPPTPTSAANTAPIPCGMHGSHTPRPPATRTSPERLRNTRIGAENPGGDGKSIYIQNPARSSIYPHNTTANAVESCPEGYIKPSPTHPIVRLPPPSSTLSSQSPAAAKLHSRDCFRFDLVMDREGQEACIHLPSTSSGDCSPLPPPLHSNEVPKSRDSFTSPPLPHPREHSNSSARNHLPTSPTTPPHVCATCGSTSRHHTPS